MRACARAPVCVCACARARTRVYVRTDVEKYPIKFSTLFQGREEGRLLTFFPYIYILFDMHSEQVILIKGFMKYPKDYGFLQARGRIPYKKLQNVNIYLLYNREILDFIF